MNSYSIGDVIVDRDFSNLDDLNLSTNDILKCLPDMDERVMCIKSKSTDCKFIKFVISVFGNNTSKYIRKLSKSYDVSILLDTTTYTKSNRIHYMIGTTRLYRMIELYVDVLKDTEFPEFVKHRLSILIPELCDNVIDTYWMSDISKDALDYIYSHYRNRIIKRLDYFHYNAFNAFNADIDYWHNGGTRLFTFNDVNEILLYLDKKYDISYISDDVVKFKLSHEDWVRVKNKIIETLNDNMNNVSALYDIMIYHDIVLSDHDIDNIRKCLKGSYIELHDFSPYYNVISTTDINYTEISKDIDVFLSRGGDISTIHVVNNNGCVNITYNMMMRFMDAYNYRSYIAFEDDEIVDAFIDSIPFIDNPSINKIASMVISDDIFKYPPKLVDYLISYTGYTIDSINSRSFNVMTYMISKKCDIDEIIILRDKVAKYPDIIGYIPWQLLKYIPNSYLINAIMTSEKFYYNVKMHLDYNHIEIPDKVVNLFPGYYSPEK